MNQLFIYMHIEKLDDISRIKFKIFIGNVSYKQRYRSFTTLPLQFKMADVGIGNP